jgi:hypothetical protein
LVLRVDDASFQRAVMSLKMRDIFAGLSWKRGLATDCALIAAAVAVAIVAQYVEPLFRKHDTLFTALMRLFG